MADDPSTAPPRRSVFTDDRPGGRRPRPELSREIIVDAALTLLDREGADALTLRRLAADLGAGVTSLYWYVPNREALLDLALDAVAGQVWAAIPNRSRTATGQARWRTDLRQVAVQMYLGLGGRPWAGRQQLVSADRGPNQMRVWDHIGRVCLRAGLTDEQAFHAMTAVLSYVLGYVSQETAPTHPGIDRETHLTALGSYMRSLPADQFPALHRLVPVFIGHDQRAQFDAGLDLILQGLHDQLTSPR